MDFHPVGARCALCRRVAPVDAGRFETARDADDCTLYRVFVCGVCDGGALRDCDRLPLPFPSAALVSRGAAHPLVSLSQAAASLGIDRHRLEAMIEEGRLESFVLPEVHAVRQYVLESQLAVLAHMSRKSAHTDQRDIGV